MKRSSRLYWPTMRTIEAITAIENINTFEHLLPCTAKFSVIYAMVIYTITLQYKEHITVDWQWQ